MHTITSAVAILATALCAAAPALAQTQPQGSYGTVAVSALARSYRVGDSSVSERVGSARLDYYLPRLHLRLDGGQLRFRAPSDTIAGRLPVAVLASFASRPGDTLAVFARSASDPLELTARQTSALATAGTSTIDLESDRLGSPAVGGARLALSLPIGDLVLGTRVGLDFEPRPSGAGPVYWRGTTLRGGLLLTASVGEGSVVASLDATRSSGDSLGGRNLFPGGGSVTAQLAGTFSVVDPFDPLDDMRWPLQAVLFYGRPYGDERADQPNLLIPRGHLLGGYATLVIPVRDVLLAPALQLLRESSTGSTTSGLVTSALRGEATTATASIDATIPLGDTFELVPQLGYTIGSVSATSSQTTVFRRGRGIVRSSSFSDGIRGTAIGVTVTARF